MSKNKELPVTYEVKKEEFITSQGLDAYDYTTSKVDAIYLKVQDKEVLVDAIEMGYHESNTVWGDFEKDKLPMNEKEVDALLQTENRTFIAPENLDKAIIELQNLLNSQSNEKSEGFEQLKSKSSRLGKAIFNTLFFDEYRQQLIEQANQRKIEMVKPTEFMYINPAETNPKGENVREQEYAKMKEMKDSHKVIIGLEMVKMSEENEKKLKEEGKPVLDLAKMCDKNIDPQHTGQNIETSCVQELAERLTLLLGKYKHLNSEGIVAVTNRMDLDSVAAYIILNKYLHGENVDVTKIMPQIKKITEHDSFLKDKTWKPKSLEEAFNISTKNAHNPNDAEDELIKCKALSSLIDKPFMKPNKEVLDAIEQYLMTDKVDEKIINGFKDKQKAIYDITTQVKTLSEAKILTNKKLAEAKANGKVPHFSIVCDVDGISVVISTEKAGTDIGYTKNPVVLAVNPVMQNRDGSTYRKLTVCQHGNGYADMDGILAEMKKIEPECGGQPNIKGSTQGQDSKLDLDYMIDAIKKNLTPEYNRQWIARKTQSGNANNGKGMGE